jgi:hypothetical protein
MYSFSMRICSGIVTRVIQYTVDRLCICWFMILLVTLLCFPDIELGWWRENFVFSYTWSVEFAVSGLGDMYSTWAQ